MTPTQLSALLGNLLRRVPLRIRRWVYLGLALAALIVLIVSWVRSGFSLEQIGLALVSLAFGLARSNASLPSGIELPADGVERTVHVGPRPRRRCACGLRSWDAAGRLPSGHGRDSCPPVNR